MLCYCCCIEYTACIFNTSATTQHNVWPNENRDVEMGVCVTDRGFKRNLTQLTGRYNQILVYLYVLLNRASITEPFRATCGVLFAFLQLWSILVM